MDFREKAELKKRRSIRSLQLFCILVSCFHYWSLTQSILPLVTCMLVFIPILFRGVHLKLGTRTIVYTLVSAMILSVLPYQFIKQNNVFFMLPGNFLVPFCIVGAAHLCLLEHKRIILSGFSTFIFLCYLIGGDLNIGKGVWKLNNTFFLDLKWNYLISFALCLVGIFLMYRVYGLSRFVVRNKQASKRWQAKLICICSFFAVFLFSPHLQKSSVPALRYVENYLLAQLNSMSRNYQRGAKKYENENNINRPVHNKFGRDLGAIVMRVAGEYPPRLLRFYSYDTYENGIWMRELENKASVREEESEEEKVELLVVENYILNPEKYAEDLREITVYPTPFLSEKIVPLSYDSAGLSLSVDSLDAYIDNSLEAKGLSQATGIKLFRSGVGRDLSISKPKFMTKENKKFYSQVPENLREYLNMRWQDITPVTHDAREAAENIQAYFHSEYSYDLEFVNMYYEENYTYDEDFETRDIIEFFLNSDYRAGHCELFATSTVLLLRSAGFQARYVSGSTVTEQATSGDYMITRAKDLHAWVEVWDSKTKEWFVVDPTPSRGAFFKDYRPKGLDAFFESMNFKLKKIFSYVLQGEITVALAVAFFAVYNPLADFLQEPLNAALTTLFVVLLIIWRLKRKARSNSSQSMNKNLQQAQKIILKVARKYVPNPEQGSHEYMSVGEIANALAKIGVGGEVLTELDYYQQCRFGYMDYTGGNLKQLKSSFKLIPKFIKESKT
jgi:transglutaminase-like putative cysteine protease